MVTSHGIRLTSPRSRGSLSGSLRSLPRHAALRLTCSHRTSDGKSRAHLSLVPSGPSLGPRGPAGTTPPGRRPAFTRHTSRWDITHLSRTRHTRTRILAHSPSLPPELSTHIIGSHSRATCQPNRFPRAHSPIAAMAMPLDTPAPALTQRSRPPVSVLIVPYVCARQLLRSRPSRQEALVRRPPASPACSPRPMLPHAPPHGSVMAAAAAATRT